MTTDHPQRLRHYQNALMDSDRWDSYTPRNDDIVITTSYKAGTTWMQAICAALVFQKPQPSVPQDKLSPWLDANFAPIEDVIAQLEALPNRRYIKTHCPLDGCKFFDEVKYIFVGRDGRDVFASMWNHWHNMKPEMVSALNNAPGRKGPILPLPPESAEGAFEDWLAQSSFPWEMDGYPFWSHLHHAQTWWDYRHLTNIHFVHFSDLLKDIDGEMRKISAFLNIDVNEDLWPQLLEGVSFSNMKANAEKMAPCTTQGLWKNSADFFHKGTNQRWKGLLTQEQSNRYEKIAAERLTPELETWLANGS